jgi:hypothetical protein
MSRRKLLWDYVGGRSRSLRRFPLWCYRREGGRLRRPPAGPALSFCMEVFHIENLRGGPLAFSHVACSYTKLRDATSDFRFPRGVGAQLGAKAS